MELGLRIKEIRESKGIFFCGVSLQKILDLNLLLLLFAKLNNYPCHQLSYQNIFLNIIGT